MIAAAGLLSMAASSLLFLLCIYGRSYRAILGRLVTVLAIADLATNCWIFIPNWIKNGSLHFDPSWVDNCAVWIGGVRLLQVWSIVLAASIAVAILLALWKWNTLLDKMRWAPVASVPLACALNLGYLVAPSYKAQSDPYPFPYCESTNAAALIFAGELLGTFAVLGAVHIFGIIKMQEHSPGSVVRRAWQSASRYLLAFLATNACYVISVMSKQFKFLALWSCTSWWWHNVRISFYVSAGLFNLLAFGGFTCKDRLRVVTFGGTEERSFASSGRSPTRSPCRDSEARHSWQKLVDTSLASLILEDCSGQLATFTSVRSGAPEDEFRTPFSTGVPPGHEGGVPS